MNANGRRGRLGRIVQAGLVIRLGYLMTGEQAFDSNVVTRARISLPVLLSLLFSF